jgi:lipoprotein NlpI
LKQAIALKPELAIAHYNLGIVSLLAKNRLAALEQYKLLTTLAPQAADKLYAGIYQGKLLSVAPIR